MATTARQLLSWRATVPWGRANGVASSVLPPGCLYCPIRRRCSGAEGAFSRLTARGNHAETVTRVDVCRRRPAARIWDAGDADPVRVPFDIIVGSTHGDMVPIFGVAVHPGDALHSTLTYDRDAIGNTGEPGFAAYRPIAGSITLALGSGLSLPLEIVQVFDDEPTGSPFQLDTVNALASTTSFPGFNSISMLLQAHGPPDSRSTTALPRSVAEFASFMTIGSFRFQAFQPGVEPAIPRVVARDPWSRAARRRADASPGAGDWRADADRGCWNRAPGPTAELRRSAARQAIRINPITALRHE